VVGEADAVIQAKEINMKRITIALLSAIVLTSGFSQSAFADPLGVLGIRKTPNRIESADEASKLPVGTRITFSCARCGGRLSMIADEQKTQLAWFHPWKSTRCPGPCRGRVSYASERTPAGPGYPDTYNKCSRCGRPTISWTVSRSKQS
jgi:hypothetical protein